MGLDEGLIASVGMAAWSRGLNLACSGSFESTMSVVEVEDPNRFIFFASATREERRRWRTEEGGRFESSSLLLMRGGFGEASVMKCTTEAGGNIMNAVEREKE